jgi:hypothetical protein
MEVVSHNQLAKNPHYAQNHYVQNWTRKCAIYVVMQRSSQSQRESGNYLTFGLDRNAPLTVRVPTMQAEQQAQNRALLSIAEILGRRTQIRISPEVWCKWHGRWRYKRLRARHVTISCADPDQAGLVLEALVGFLRTLDGKWLTYAPEAAPGALETP